MDEYKLVVVGDSKVGKTTLTITFVEEFGSIVEDSYLKKCVVDDKLASLSSELRYRRTVYSVTHHCNSSVKFGVQAKQTWLVHEVIL